MFMNLRPILKYVRVKTNIFETKSEQIESESARFLKADK
jgi:hypothetical protein